jgi:hypothetical protein
MGILNIDQTTRSIVGGGGGDGGDGGDGSGGSAGSGNASSDTNGDCGCGSSAGSGPAGSGSGSGGEGGGDVSSGWTWLDDPTPPPTSWTPIFGTTRFDLPGCGPAMGQAFGIGTRRDSTYTPGWGSCRR